MSEGYCRRGVVLDHSDQGVRVRLQSRESLPDQIELHVPALSIKRKAKIIWRDGVDIGVAFDDGS